MRRERGTRIAVVGGGITGLSAAHRLVELGREQSLPVDVAVLEESDRLGGHIRTERTGEYLLEAGPDSLLARKPAALRLCQRIGLAEDVLPVAAGGTDVVRRGRLLRVPDSFFLIAPQRLGPTLRSPLLSLRGKLRMLCEPWIAPRPPDTDDESLASFVKRRFGREVLERIAEPIVAGLYTAESASLSLRLTLPQFLDMEREEGSVFRALRKAAPARGSRQASFLTLRGGLERLIERLAARLAEGSIRLCSPVEAIRHDRIGSAFKIHLAGGGVLEADAVVLACAAYVSSRILRQADADLASRLTQLDYASCATVTLAYPKRALRSGLGSFGFFVPRAERLPILACSYVNAKFEERAPADTVVLRSFLGGAQSPEVMDGDDETLARLAHETLARLLTIEGRPCLARVHRFPRSMPQYRVGQARFIAEVRERADRHPGLCLAGSTVGAKGLPECVQSGEEAAERAFELLAARSEGLQQAI